MADLPINLWHPIFDHLELTDLPTCALVSKTLYSAVKAYQIQEIAFTRRVYRWFHYITAIRSNYKHRADFTKTTILARSSFNFDYLKCLKISRLFSTVDLNIINRFVHLEELDIDLENYEKKARTLRLANLEVLYVFVPNHFPCLELDTPRLAKVGTFSLKRLMFIYPESVRCIHTFYHAGRLPLFRNLECLIFTDNYNEVNYRLFGDSLKFEDFSLNVKILKKLKEIDFHFYYRGYEKRNMGNFKRIVANLLAQERPDLKVFWLHVQVTNINLLTEYEDLLEKLGNIESERIAIFHLRHSKLKDKAEFCLPFYFNSLMSKLPEVGVNLRNEELISKFIAKIYFKRIDVIDKVVERELLMELIAKSSNLLVLRFRNSRRLDQSFFDRMAEIVRLNGIRLKWLLIQDSPSVLNYEFVRKLQHLEWFETNQQLPNEFVSKLIALPMLDKINFSPGLFSTNTIERISTTRYLLNGRSLSLHELLKHFDSGTDSTVLEAATAMVKVIGLW